MTDQSVKLSLLALLLIAGCSKSPEPAARYGFTDGAAAPSQQEAARSESGRAQRFVTVAHKLVIETSEADLPKAWESTAQFCGTLRCEIISSSISNKTQDSPPSGSFSLRIVPEDLKKLLDHLGKAGSIFQHVTESEDKTGVVIDVEAKLKNLTAFRDRLRSMLAKPSAGLKDVIEVERELS